MQSSFANLHGLKLHYLKDGPNDGPLVILLHGFPESANSWRHQIPYLAALGKCVVAPDLRGYPESDKPAGIAAYDLDRLAEDIASLMDFFGRERAVVVGHDWGGGVAWHVAEKFPERVERLVVLDCPHPWVLGRAFLSDPIQLARSWYMLFFQLPFIPEWVLKGDRLRRFITSWGASFMEAGEVSERVRSFDETGAMTTAINYYRAAFRRVPRSLFQVPKVNVPTLIVWGELDKILGLALARESARLVTKEVRIEVVRGAGHFVQQEAPDEVNSLLRGFV